MNAPTRIKSQIPDLRNSSRINQDLQSPSMDLMALLDSAGIPCRRVGKEIEADFDQSGHLSYKLNPRKGVYFSTTGKKGKIASLLRSHKLPDTAYTGQASALPKKNIGIARHIWSSGWTCTHRQDMPVDWDKGLNASQKGAVRIKHAEEREAVITYLTARLGPEHVEEHWLRQIRIARDRLGQIMMLVPMYKDGEVVGIQRTYLTPNGKKIVRKMLGQKGVLPLSAPTGVNPAQLAGVRNMLIGEGFETVAAAIQTAGYGGIVCFDAVGLTVWAESQARVAAEQSKEQLDNTPTATILADNDESQTGQKASAKAVRALRKAGLKAHFALPPLPENGGPKGGPKGSDWGDYPQEGLSHAMLAHLQMAVSNGDSEMPVLDADDDAKRAELEETHDFTWLRLAENLADFPVTDTVEQVRDNLKTDFQKLVEDYLDWWGSQRDAKDPSLFQPVLFQITTGAGKSRYLKKLITNLPLRKAGVRVCVGVGDHAQAAEFEAVGYFHFWGRQPNEEKCPAAYCPAHEDLAKAVDREHIPQAEYCNSCPHGIAWSIEKVRAKLEDGNVSSQTQVDDLEERIQQLVALLLRMGLDPGDVLPCPWQQHLKSAMDAQFVVMHHLSYSDSLVNNALYFADESFDIGKTVTINLGDIAQWAKELDGQVRHFSVHPPLADEGRETQVKKARMAMQMLADRMAYWAGQGKSGAVELDAG
ncbi:hypothetical protein B1757_04700, partial [Acidithiobacillus marinus]